MDYATVAAAALAPAPDGIEVPQAVLNASPARRLRDAIEPIAMHAVWSPLVHERLAARGLDFFMTYAWGRACVLGEPTGAVVAATFGAFEPSMIGGVCDEARRRIGRVEVLTTTRDSAGDGLREVIGDDDAVGPTADRLHAAVISLDAAGRPLFAGVQALDRPADDHAALWQACLALREHRGDAHIAAYTGAGFDPVQMNILTELWLGYEVGEYSGTRAWPANRTAQALAALEANGLIENDQITETGRVARNDIEAHTEAMEQPVVDALGDDLDDLVTQLNTWSQRCIDAGMFPPDPRKRAAG